MYIKMDTDFGNYDIVLFFRKWYNFVMGYLGYFWDILQNYGWQIVFFSFVFYYVYKNFVRPLLENTFEKYDNYKKIRKEHEYTAKYHKNPDLFSERISEQQNYAQKLQEKYDRELEEYQQKQAEKIAQKREETLKEIDRKIGGNRLGHKEENNKNKPFKPEYNPLMGTGSSSSYRAPKRSACSGGGCG